MSWNLHIWCLLGVSMLLVAAFDLVAGAKLDKAPSRARDVEWQAVDAREVEWTAIDDAHAEWVAVAESAAP